MIGYQKLVNLLPFHKKQPEKPDSEKSMAQMHLLLKEAQSQQVEQAKAAAADGTGPQSWDADWFENELDLGEEALALTETWSWQHVQLLQEALTWALASPQAQRARQEEENAPRDPTLQMIQDLQQGLTWRSHTLLSQHAKALGYSKQPMGDLNESLDELLYPEAEEQEA
jgi:hypothetical protein